MLCSWIFQRSQKGNYVPSTKHFYSLVHARGVMNCFFRPLLYRSIKECIHLINHIGFFVPWNYLIEKPWSLWLLLFVWRHKLFFTVNPLCWWMRPNSFGMISQDPLHCSVRTSTAQHESSQPYMKIFSWIKWKERSHTTKQNCPSSHTHLGNPKPRSWTANLGCTWSYIFSRGQWPRCCVAVERDFFFFPSAWHYPR